MYYNSIRHHVLLDAVAILTKALPEGVITFSNGAVVSTFSTPTDASMRVVVDVSDGVMSARGPEDALNRIGVYAGGYKHDIDNQRYTLYPSECAYDKDRAVALRLAFTIEALKAEATAHTLTYSARESAFQDADSMIDNLAGARRVWSDPAFRHWSNGHSVSYIMNMKPEAIRDALTARKGCHAAIDESVLSVDVVERGAEGVSTARKIPATINDVKTMSPAEAAYVRLHPEVMRFEKDRSGLLVPKSTILTMDRDNAEWMVETLSCISVVRSLKDYIKWNLGGSPAGMDSLEAKPHQVSFYSQREASDKVGDVRYVSIADMSAIADTLSAKIDVSGDRIDYEVLSKILGQSLGQGASIEVESREDVSGCHVFDTVRVSEVGKPADTAVDVALDDRFDRTAFNRAAPAGYFSISVSKSGDASPLAKTLLSSIEDMGAVSYEQAISSQKNLENTLSSRPTNDLSR